ncbi:MAG: carbohydrate ABC transporter permease [Clostridia bacterium]|nr:carbohydrate ABC transporter permease [Clostridia bacterium]
MKKRPSRLKVLKTARLTLFFIWALAFAVVFVAPTLFTFTNSFMSERELTSSYGAVLGDVAGGSSYISEEVKLKLIPDMVSFRQYFTVLFQSPDYLLKFWNSVIFTLPIVFGQVAIASLASYGFYRYKGKVKNIIFFSYIIIMLMPYQVTLVPNFLVSEMLGIINTRWAIILPGLFTPLSVFILTKSMRRVPPAAIEAARLDGAGEFKIFRKICLPMCKNALYSVIILTFIDNWNMVEQVLILLENPELQPLSVFLSEINTGEVGVAFAVATVYMIPPILLFLHGEESLVEGITYQGSVKG